MRAVLQRVRRAKVAVDGITVGEIAAGWLVLLGVGPADTAKSVNWLADKVANLRAFDDADGKMNLSVQDVNGGVLVVSQFTLYGDCAKGRRPSFTGAAPPAVAEPLYEAFVAALEDARRAGRDRPVRRRHAGRTGQRRPGHVRPRFARVRKFAMDRRTFLASTGAVALGSLAPAAQPKEKVTIVSSLPRTGSAKGPTDQIVNAIKMAVADFEKTVPFEVTYLDWDDATVRSRAWNAEKEKDNAEKAVADKDVMAFLGPYNSGAAMVSAPILNAAGLVQVSSSASWPGLTKKVPSADADEPEKYRPGKKVTFCRVCPHDASQGPLSADFVAGELKAKSVYVIDDKSLYGSGVAALFKKRCEELKLKVVSHDIVSPTQRDYKALMTKIKDKGPDVVYFGGTTQTGGPRVAKAMHDDKVNCPLMVPDGCYELAFVNAVGAEAFDALKCFVTIGGIAPAHLKGAGADFVKRYTEKYGKAPDADAVYGYEAAAVVLEALCAAGKKGREAVRKAVLTTKDFEKGLLGKWSFDADGDTTLQPLTVATIEKGQFRAVKVMGTK